MKYSFTRIELENWKNFPTADVSMAKRVFIIGPNAIGKSNFLDAFRFLRDVVIEGGGLAKAVEWRGGMTGVRSLYARRHTDVGLTVEVKTEDGDGFKYSLQFNSYPDPKRKNEPIIKSEKVVLIKNGKEEILNNRLFHKNKDVELYTQTDIQQVSRNQKYRELADFFRSVSYLHLVPQLIRERQNPVHYGSAPDQYGRDLLEKIRNVNQRSRDSRLKKIGDILKAVTPHLDNLSYYQDLDGRPRLQVKFQHWRAHAAAQYETQLSDGTLRLIGLLWAIQEKEGVLLLEEPELSKHSEIVRRLAGFIYSIQKKSGRQVILSTHSEKLLEDEGIQSEELILISPANEGAKIECGASLEDVNNLMQNGIPASEAAMPRTQPIEIDFFGRNLP